MTDTTTRTDPKVEAIQRIYAAFGIGDVAAILDELAEDVDWAPEAAGTGVPWWGHYAGRDQVPAFFERIGANVQVTEFSPLSFTSNDTDVMCVIRFAYTVPATGRSASMEIHHWWRFAGGKVVRYRGTEDTLQNARAFELV